MAFPNQGTDQLGAPPPSPTPMGGMQGNAPFSMQGLAPQIPSNRLPPEVLTGITAAAQKVSEMLDSFAQITPDKSAQLALMKDMLQQYLADLMSSGAGAISPTASGPAFPGGGMDRGVAGAGTV
jgi:hypothetical protein